MRLKKIVAAMLAAAFAFVAVSVPDVSAATYDLNNVDWGYIYAESQCGVDYTQIQPTDYGSSFADIITKYGTTTFDNNLAFIQNSLETKGYPPDYINNLMQYYRNYLHNTKVTGENLGHYATQKAERFVDNALDVSGSSFWNSVYNKLFNNSGYNEQTETNYNGNYTFPDGTNVQFTNIDWSNFGYIYNHTTPVGYSVQGGGSVSLDWAPSGSGSACFCQVAINGHIYFYVQGWSPWPNAVWDAVNHRFICGDLNSNYWFILNCPASLGHPDEGGTTTILPEQVGFYIDPASGEKVPIYTDPTRNNFSINPDGTITLPDGTIVPIKIEPDELSPDGWSQIFDYDVKNPQPFNPQGIPWQDVKITPDGSGGSTISGLGEALEGLFKGLGEGIAAAVLGVADAVADAMGGVGELIDDLTSLDWLGDIGNIDFNVMNFTTPLTDITDLVLRLLGLDGE